MPETPDPPELDLERLLTMARGHPALALAFVLHAIEGLRLTRVLLHEPESVRRTAALAHFEQASAHLLRAKEELGQCVRAWILPDGLPAVAELAPENQTTLDAVLAARGIPQP